MHRNDAQLIDELNNRAWDLTDQCQSLELEMKINTVEDASGARVLDFGVGRTGTLSGGISLAMICMADLAEVQILNPQSQQLPLPQVQVSTDHPLVACIGSQYAGWPFSHGKYYSMCSGPARMARGKEDLLSEYELEVTTERVVGILESNEYPTPEAIKYFAEECRVEPDSVTLCIARTASIPGTLQVVARSIETTMHKLQELKFDLRSINSAIGIAPLPPIAKDDLTALGWTNDSILYGAQSHLWVAADDEWIEEIGPQIPSNSSSDFGIPFIEIFQRYERDFYKIDKMLFSPASVVINNINSGKTFKFGEIRDDILKSSFGIG